MYCHVLILQISSSLSGCFPAVGDNNRLCVFVIRDATTNKIFQSISHHGPHSSFGILSQKPLPCSMVIHMYYRF